MTKSEVLEQIKTLRALTEQITRQNGELEERILAEYAQANRLYPDGYALTDGGVPVTIHGVLVSVDGSEIELAYGLHRNGEPYNAIAEKNVGKPEYA